MVEQEDFASGTSSKSTKLVHGGVRYLEKAVKQLDYGQLKLVFEALHERKHVLDQAPHLAKPLPIMTPCYKWWEVPYYWAGKSLGMSDAPCANRAGPESEQPHDVCRDEALRPGGRDPGPDLQPLRVCRGEPPQLPDPLSSPGARGQVHRDPQGGDPLL